MDDKIIEIGGLRIHILHKDTGEYTFEEFTQARANELIGWALDRDYVVNPTNVWLRLSPRDCDADRN